MWVIQKALPYLRERGAGHIIQISSAAGLLAMPLGGAYQISKWALEALNESLAQEVADFGITVTVVAPAGFATRSGKNPDPLANGHVAEANPAYAGASRDSRESSPPATRPPRRRHSSRSSTPTTHHCEFSSARASTRCSSRSTPTASRPGPTGSTCRWRPTAGSIKPGDPVAARDASAVHLDEVEERTVVDMSSRAITT
ncbi:SDR family NAD(P)-dependent oxidoreductase [Pseudonocardia sp. DLS-67]